MYQAGPYRRLHGTAHTFPRVERSKDPILVLLPDPWQLSLVTFFFARKESDPPPRGKRAPPWKGVEENNKPQAVKSEFDHLPG